MQPGPWGMRYLMDSGDDDRTREQAAESEELPEIRPGAWAAWAQAAPTDDPVEGSPAPATAPTGVSPAPAPGPMLRGGSPAGSPAR